MVQKKDNLISVQMAYLSLPYDKPNFRGRTWYHDQLALDIAAILLLTACATRALLDHVCGSQCIVHGCYAVDI